MLYISKSQYALQMNKWVLTIKAISWDNFSCHSFSHSFIHGLLPIYMSSTVPANRYKEESEAAPPRTDSPLGEEW